MTAALTDPTTELTLPPLEVTIDLQAWDHHDEVVHVGTLRFDAAPYLAAMPPENRAAALSHDDWAETLFYDVRAHGITAHTGPFSGLHDREDVDAWVAAHTDLLASVPQTPLAPLSLKDHEHATALLLHAATLDPTTRAELLDALAAQQQEQLGGNAIVVVATNTRNDFYEPLPEWPATLDQPTVYVTYGDDDMQIDIDFTDAEGQNVTLRLERMGWMRDVERRWIVEGYPERETKTATLDEETREAVVEYADALHDRAATVVQGLEFQALEAARGQVHKVLFAPAVEVQ